MPAVRPRPCESVVGAADTGHDLTAGSCDPQRRRERELPRSALLHTACNVILLVAGQVACVLCIVYTCVAGCRLRQPLICLRGGREPADGHEGRGPLLWKVSHHPSLTAHPSLLTPHSSLLTHTVRVRQPPWSRPTCCGPSGQTRTLPIPPSGLASGGSPQRRRWTSLWPSVWLVSASSGR